MDATRLFEEHHAALHRYLVRLSGDPDVAADAAQEAFVKLVAKPPADGSPKAWLYTVATNHVRAWANTRKRQTTLLARHGGRAGLGDGSADPLHAAQAAELKGIVRRALDALSEKERTILLMREEGFAHREIAEVVGTTTGSVGTMIARALDKLAELLPLDHEDL
jgi:RNA polymerase sigma-70 factor (ECF subfamily)